ncbi:polyphenol oxidase family protein [Psychrobacter frigidicola]|uniref:polyphenol oxidase family protein n=1 Tax=Psychrobacter frigidicola TaxID=45611 RepID=UPI00191B11B1|nr:polyphenol oxidase family protein [Psychrobacter frigidicola]
MTNKFPMTALAQIGDVTVFQTAAFQTGDFANTITGIETDIAIESIAVDIAAQNNQYILQARQTSYGELNLGLHVNDDADKVLDNRMRLLTAINEQLAIQQRLPIKSLHWVNQVHGKKIYDIDTGTLTMRPMDADAIVSQQANLGLAIMTADCVPIVLYQPVSGQIAAIHAGWQGLACGVIKATAERFTAAGQIMAWIGVSISQAHYEVGRQVRDKLLEGCVKNKTLAPSNLDYFDQLYCIAVNNVANTERLDKMGAKLSDHATVGAGKVKLNLPKLANDQLVAVGITVCTDLPVDCSYADAHYYSYRRQTHLPQPATGRMALIIVCSLPV